MKNEKVLHLITEIKVGLGEQKTDLKYLRRNVKEHNTKLDTINDKLIVVDHGLKNHLKAHKELTEKTHKEQMAMFKTLGLLVAGISVITGIVLKIIFR